MVTFAEAFKQAKSTDEELQKIAGFLTKLEQAIIVEYRKLLESGCGYASELLKLPVDGKKRYSNYVKKLLQALHSTGDASNLQVVSALHEDLRIRLMVLDHLLERDAPYAYLERALNCALNKVVLVDNSKQKKEETKRPGQHEATNVTTNLHDKYEESGFFSSMVSALFGKRKPQSKPGLKPVKKFNRISLAELGIKSGFQQLPDHLKRLYLLYNFMEVDDLDLMAGNRVPGIGHGFMMQGTLAVFVAGNGVAQHWDHRGDRQDAKNNIARNVEELRKKLEARQQHLLVGERSKFVVAHDAGRDVIVHAPRQVRNNCPLKVNNAVNRAGSGSRSALGGIRRIGQKLGKRSLQTVSTTVEFSNTVGFG